MKMYVGILTDKYFLSFRVSDVKKTNGVNVK